MSLLLGRSIASASKAGARRRLFVSPLSSSSSSSSLPSNLSSSSSALELWFYGVEQSLWHRHSRSTLLKTTVRSLAVSLEDQRQESEEEKNQNCRRQLAVVEWNNPSAFTSTGLANRVLPSSEIMRINSFSSKGTNRRFMSTCSRTGSSRTWPTASSRQSLTAAQHNRIFAHTQFRYVHPPVSIRANLALTELMAAERAASDMALRSLTTWASQYCQSALLRVAATSSSRHGAAGQQVVFFSTRGQRRKIAKTKIPTPESEFSNQKSMKPEDVMNEINKKSKTVILPAILSGLKTVLQFIVKLPFNLVYYLTHPAEMREQWNKMKKLIKDEVDHYWVGTKLLWADLKTARALLRRTLRGSSLTRRERKQLLRTISDLFRLVPFSMFLIIPLMEFALPFALKIFPNLLPSTFQDSLKAEENMKRELQTRIAMAKFFQETLEELAKEQKQSATKLKKEIKESGDKEDIDESEVEKQEQSAASFLRFMEKARNGEMIPNDVIIRYAQNFKDDLTLDNMPRMQLINMCKYMGIPPYGSDAFLRFQLRHRMRSLREDDQRILWEGIDSLTKMELREACQERGMRSTGLSKDAYKRALQQWLDLSVKQNVPTSLLIMSRTFFLREDTFETEPDDGTKSLAGLADAISGLDKEVVNEVILDVATSQEKMSDPGVRKIKLEVLMKQNEMIQKEYEERKEAAAKKKEQAQKEKKEPEIEVLQKESSQPAMGSESVPTDAVTTEKEMDALMGPSLSVDKVPTEKVKDSKADEDLSTAEMDAISQLVSADPVSRERADLESIKAALQDEKRAVEEKPETSAESGAEGVETMSSNEGGTIAAKHVKESADEALHVSDDDEVDEAPDTSEHDPVVARLKKRIESMVDKIEVQLSDVQVKIGDKLHVLDKDMDGILTVDEIAQALQQVLKRKITHEEAMEIAQEMDENKDGFFTVQELVAWVETNLLVKFVEEGRDADMDRIIEKQSVAEQQELKEDDNGGQVAEQKK